MESDCSFRIVRLNLEGPVLGMCRFTPATYTMLCHLDLIQQIGVAVEDFEELDEG